MLWEDELDIWNREGKGLAPRELNHRPGRKAIGGRQIAVALLVMFYFAPALITGRPEDWGVGGMIIVASSPLLLWLRAPLTTSDDLWDEMYRQQVARVDLLASVVFWTAPRSFDAS